MQRTGFIYIDDKKYEVFIRTQTTVTEWVTLGREILKDEPDEPSKYEESLSRFVNETPDVAETLIVGGTIRV